jgi:hypothetical protein
MVTRYAALTRSQAVAVVVVLCAATLWLLTGAAATPTPGRSAAESQDNDVALYRAIVERVRAGEGYYDAAGAELRGRHYPTRPVFNWRQPTYAWLLSRLPSPLVGNALLALVAGAVVLLTRRWLRAARLEARTVWATALMVVTMAGCLVANFVFLQESWAGSLIVLSACLFALDLWPLAVAAALAALAFRELALLPCAVGLALALRRRRWREVAAWLVGFAAYGALMAWHFAEVARHLRPDDLARGGWVAWGGSAFILTTCQWSPLLVALPRWAVALIVPLMLLGLAGWGDAGATRVALVVFGYLVVFSVVGRAFNDYWGSTFVPLLSFGLLAAPDALRDLSRALGVRLARGAS